MPHERSRSLAQHERGTLEEAQKRRIRYAGMERNCAGNEKGRMGMMSEKLTDEQKRIDLVDLIRKEYKEGLLYDLNRDMVTCLTWISQPDSEVWINNCASGIVIEYLCKQRDTLRAELEEWKADAERLALWLENVPIDYSNGNVAPNGMDEGIELGWKGHKELLKVHHALLGEIEEGEECDPTELPF